MSAKDNTKKVNRYHEIRSRIIDEMNAKKLDVTQYGLTIDLAAQILYERERAYSEYLEKGARQTLDGETANPYAEALRSWNYQAWTCLTNLRLIP